SLVDLGERAARWRADLDAEVDRALDFEIDGTEEALDVSVESMRPYGPDALAIIWPALLARIGIAADWRGTRRLVGVTKSGSTSQRIQLSGGWVVHRRRRSFSVRRFGTT